MGQARAIDEQWTSVRRHPPFRCRCLLAERAGGVMSRSRKVQMVRGDGIVRWVCECETSWTEVPRADRGQTTDDSWGVSTSCLWRKFLKQGELHFLDVADLRIRNDARIYFEFVVAELYLNSLQFQRFTAGAPKVGPNRAFVCSTADFFFVKGTRLPLSVVLPPVTCPSCRVFRGLEELAYGSASLLRTTI